MKYAYTGPPTLYSHWGMWYIFNTEAMGWATWKANFAHKRAPLGITQWVNANIMWLMTVFVTCTTNISVYLSLLGCTLMDFWSTLWRPERQLLLQAGVKFHLKYVWDLLIRITDVLGPASNYLAGQNANIERAQAITQFLWVVGENLCHDYWLSDQSRYYADTKNRQGGVPLRAETIPVLNNCVLRNQ